MTTWLIELIADTATSVAGTLRTTWPFLVLSIVAAAAVSTYVGTERMSDQLRRHAGLATVAAVALAFGQEETAVTLAAAGAAHRQQIGVSLPEIYLERYRRVETAVCANVADAEQQRLWQTGQDLSLDDAVALALESLLEMSDN